MKHVDDFETTTLPEWLGREFAAGAPCVAVLVEAGEGTRDLAQTDSTPAANDARTAGSSRRASATVYRVGDAYVVECEDADGAVETVGMGPGQLDAYVERVRGDDEWTVLSLADELGARRERPRGESAAGR